MGFGILLVGYFLTFATSLSTSYFFADIPGAVLMLYAVYKLSRYSDGFKKSVPVLIGFSLISVLCALLTAFNVNSKIFSIADGARSAAVLVVHVFIFKSLEIMAHGAEDEKLASKAKRNLIVVMGYYLFYIIYIALSPFLDSTMTGYFEFLCYLYKTVFIVLNLLLLHSAYSKLYLEGAEEALVNEGFPEFRESKICFLNPIRRKFYESQKKAFEENYKMMKETYDYTKSNPPKAKKKKKKKN